MPQLRTAGRDLLLNRIVECLLTFCRASMVNYPANCAIYHRPNKRVECFYRNAQCFFNHGVRWNKTERNCQVVPGRSVDQV